MIKATELEYWASLGRLDRVADALAENPDANIRGEEGYTAMHAAAENGHLEVIRFLAERGQTSTQVPVPAKRQFPLLI